MGRAMKIIGDTGKRAYSGENADQCPDHTSDKHPEKILGGEFDCLFRPDLSLPRHDCNTVSKPGGTPPPIS